MTDLRSPLQGNGGATVRLTEAFVGFARLHMPAAEPLRPAWFKLEHR